VSKLAQDALLQLHAHLLKRDREDAPDEMAGVLLPWLIEQLTRAYPGVSDSHLITESGVDALWEYLRRPERYQPDRASLTTYLMVAARGDLLNKLQKQKRIAVHEKNYEEGVELEVADGNMNMGDDLEVVETVAQVSHAVNQKIPDGADRKVLELMMSGERRTSEYAKVLGIELLPADRQACEVKRVKDRLKKVLIRLKGGDLRVD